MKKIKFLGTAILAASLLFAGCSSPVEDVVTEEDTSVTLSPEETGSNSGTTNDGTSTGGTTTGGNSNGGSTGGSGSGGSSTGGSTEPVINYTAPDLSTYYKNYLVSSPRQAANRTVGDWTSGSANTDNEDGTWNLVSAHLWNASEGVCAALTGFDEGTFANYEYIVFTVDTTNFVIERGDGNKGVNVKIAKSGTSIGDQKSVIANCVSNGNVKTYYAPISLFANDVLAVSNEAAIIIGGTGTLKLNEVYLAAAEDPSLRAITGISITPASESLERNGTLQFIVKDSNLVTRTSEVSYILDGVAAVDSNISETGLLTVGTTAGSLTVTASYTVEGRDNPFTAEATITVLGELTNLITEISSVPFACYGPNWNWQLHTGDINNAPVGDIDDFVTRTDDSVTYNIPDATYSQWQAQIKIVTDAAIEEGDSWILTLDVEGINCANGTLQIGSVEAATALKDTSFSATADGSTITVTGTATTSVENIALHFDLAPGSTDENGVVVFSNFRFSKTN